MNGYPDLAHNYEAASEDAPARGAGPGRGGRGAGRGTGTGAVGQACRFAMTDSYPGRCSRRQRAKTRFSSLLLAAAGATVVAGAVLVGQSARVGAGPARRSTTDSTWATYGGDLGNRRYVPFDRDQRQELRGDLEVAWRFSTANLGPSPEYSFESTPLVVDGVLYTTAGSRRSVVALDAATRRDALDAPGRRGAAGSERPAPAIRPRVGVLDRRIVGRGSSTSRPATG